MPTRFVDDRRTLYGFASRFDIECPRCAKRAEVRSPRLPLRATSAVLTCTHCGYADRRNVVSPLVSDWGDVLDPGSATLGGSVDWFFARPLWLRTPCAGAELWAYNVEHLDYLRAYVGAGLRRRESTRSMGARLPKWMTSAKNRAGVLRCLGRLQRRAEQDA